MGECKEGNNSGPSPDPIKYKDIVFSINTSVFGSEETKTIIRNLLNSFESLHIKDSNDGIIISSTSDNCTFRVSVPFRVEDIGKFVEYVPEDMSLLETETRTELIVFKHWLVGPSKFSKFNVYARLIDALDLTEISITTTIPALWINRKYDIAERIGMISKKVLCI